VGSLLDEEYGPSRKVGLLLGIGEGEEKRKNSRRRLSKHQAIVSGKDFSKEERRHKVTMSLVREGRPGEKVQRRERDRDRIGPGEQVARSSMVQGETKNLGHDSGSRGGKWHGWIDISQSSRAQTKEKFDGGCASGPRRFARADN